MLCKLKVAKKVCLRYSTSSIFSFDELHYGKYVSLYMKNIFFFEKHPPFGKQLIAGAAYLAGYDGNFTFNRIGSEYTSVSRL